MAVDPLATNTLYTEPTEEVKEVKPRPLSRQWFEKIQKEWKNEPRIEYAKTLCGLDEEDISDAPDEMIEPAVEKLEKEKERLAK